MLSAIVGGAPPDLLPLGSYPGDWIARGVVRPLDDLIARDRAQPDGIRLEDYYPASLAHVRANGRIYAIPDWAIGMALYYNKNLFVEAGLTDTAGQARPPSTWTEWFHCNKVLTRRDQDGNLVRIGGYPGGYVPSLFTVGTQLGASFLSEDGRTCTIGEPASVEALRLLVRFSDYFGGRRRLDTFKALEQFGGIDPLFVGGEAMRIEGQWYITNFARFGPDIDYDVAPIPHPAGQPRVDFQITTAWGIPVGARNPELAWKFLKWYASDEAQEIKVRETIAFTRNRGYPFTPFTTANRRINRLIEQKYVRDNPVFPFKTRRTYAKFVENLETATSLRPVGGPAGQLLDDELNRAYEMASLQRVHPEEALDRARMRLQEALDRYWEETRLPLFRWDWSLLIIGSIAAALTLWILRRLGLQLVQSGRQQRRETLAGMLCVAPWGVGFAIFMAGPIIFSFLLSFSRYNVVRPARWVGLDNYIALFTADPLFWKSLYNTLFMLLGVPLGLALGLGLALLLNQAVAGMSFYRTIYYLPSIVPAVASALLWVWIFHPASGLMNTALDWLGVEGPLWLQSEAWAKPAIILNGLWGAGGSMIVWLAGLKGIPDYLYEAAHIDGAGRWSRFRYVTLPMLTPYILFNAVVGVIATLQIFTQAMVMTSGGPLDATLFYVYYLFNNAFAYFRMGYASAMAWVLFFIILSLTLLQLKIAPKWVHYEGEET